MVRTVVLGVLLCLLAGACASQQQPDQDGDAVGSDVVVSTWLAALDELDLEGLNATTDPANVALVAGAENGFSTEQMVAIVDAGMPATTAQSYWATFRLGLASLIGDEVASIGVGEPESFLVDEASYSAVPLGLDDASTEVIAFEDEAAWRVDLVATVGPALAVQIRRLVAQLVEEADESVARRYALIAVGSLSAALERDPGNRALELELEAIEDLPIDLTA